MREFKGWFTGSPRQADRQGEPGNIPGRINVRVQPSSTLTGEAMPLPFSDGPASRAGLARVRRINKHNTKPSSFGLVGNEVLQLPKGPSMQPRPDALSGLDVGADVGQVFHADFTAAGADCFGNNGLAGFVVDMFDVPLFFAGDSAELAFSSPATVGLETAAVGKVDVPVMPEFPAPEHLACAGSGEVILANIKAEHPAGNWRRIGKIEDEIEIPDALEDNQLGFFGRTTGKQVALMLAADERNLDAPVEGEQREHIAFDRVGALVEVDRRWSKTDGRNRLVLGNALVGLERLVGIGHAVHGLAHHLAAKRRQEFAHRIVSQMVQRHTVPAAMLDGERNYGVAGTGEGVRKSSQRSRLFSSRNKFEGYRAFHIGNMIRSSYTNNNRRRTFLPGIHAGVSSANTF